MITGTFQSDKCVARLPVSLGEKETLNKVLNCVWEIYDLTGDEYPMEIIIQSC